MLSAGRLVLKALSRDSAPAVGLVCELAVFVHKAAQMQKLAGSVCTSYQLLRFPGRGNVAVVAPLVFSASLAVASGEPPAFSLALANKRLHNLLRAFIVPASPSGDLATKSASSTLSNSLYCTALRARSTWVTVLLSTRRATLKNNKSGHIQYFVLFVLRNISFPGMLSAWPLLGEKRGCACASAGTAVIVVERMGAAGEG